MTFTFEKIHDAMLFKRLSVLPREQSDAKSTEPALVWLLANSDFVVFSGFSRELCVANESVRYWRSTMDSSPPFVVFHLGCCRTFISLCICVEIKVFLRVRSVRHQNTSAASLDFSMSND